MVRKLLMLLVTMFSLIFIATLVTGAVILSEDKVIDLRTPFVINVNTGSTGGSDGNASSICSGSEVLLGNGTCTTVSSLAGDTNETDRFTALTDSDCVAGELVIGIQVNGIPLCAAD